MLYLLITSGLRRGELSGLQWHDIDFNRCTIDISRNITYTKENGLKVETPKTDESMRTIQIIPFVAEELKRYRAAEHPNAKENSFIFPSPKGEDVPRALSNHPRARCRRRFLYGEQYGSDAATAPRVLEHADIAYQEAVVPSLRRALDIADQLPALKRAECCRLLKLLAEEHIVERPFFGFAEGRVLHTEAAFASADVIIALRLIARGELPSGVFFSFQALDLHSFSPSSSVGLKRII